MRRPLATSFSFLVVSVLSSIAWCGGSVSGTVSYQGDVPVQKRQPVLMNEDVCGKEGVSEDFIVGKRATLKNAVVYIQGPVAGSRKMQVPDGGFKVDQS